MFDGEKRGVRRFAFHIEGWRGTVREELAAIVEKIARTRGMTVRSGFRIAENHMNNEAPVKRLPGFDQLPPS